MMAPGARSRWSRSRLARAAFLSGRGLTAHEIATDPMVSASPEAARQALRRVGLTCRTGGVLVIEGLTPDCMAQLDRLARQRGEDRIGLAYALLETIAGDPHAGTLIANILDEVQP